MSHRSVIRAAAKLCDGEMSVLDALNQGARSECGLIEAFYEVSRIIGVAFPNLAALSEVATEGHFKRALDSLAMRDAYFAAKKKEAKVGANH